MHAPYAVQVRNAESRFIKTAAINLVRFALAAAAVSFGPIHTYADIVYVWSNDGTIQRFDANGVGSLFATNNLSGWNGPVGLALDNVANLYAGVPSESYIWKYLPNGTRSLIGYIDSISGLAFDSTGNLYATSPNYNEVFKCGYAYYYEFWGYFVTSADSQSHLAYPISLAFDNAGKIFVANSVPPPPFYNPAFHQYTNTIEKFSTNGDYLGSFATGLNQPWGLAFDSGGNLYASNSSTNRALANTIVKFLPDGTRSTFATAFSGLSSPRGLAFDSGGNLYVANAGNGTIEKFTPDGTGSLFASGLASPSAIAVFPGLKLWSASPVTLSNPRTTPSGAFRFDVTENPGLALTVISTTNLSLVVTNWTILQGITENPPGFYQFTDSQATNGSQHFYRISSP